MEPFIGQISALGFNFAPYGWMFCQGQLLPIRSYTALFSLLGTYYGGDGQTTFALPNLVNNSALGYGAAPGLSSYDIGQTGGNGIVTIQTNNMPAHTHTLTLQMSATETRAGLSAPVGNFPATDDTDTTYARSADSGVFMAGNPTFTIGQGGGSSVPIVVQRPTLVMNYSIALTGIFPMRQ